MTPQNLYLNELTILNMIHHIDIESTDTKITNLTHLSLNLLTQIGNSKFHTICRSTA